MGLRSITALFVFLHRICVVLGGCGIPPDVLHATHNGTGSSSYPVGTELKYDCKLGFYHGSGNNFYTCNNTEWVGIPINCREITCRFFEEPTNGQILDNPDYTAGSRISFSCDTGYSRVGSASLLCRIDGLWNPPNAPTCEVVVCPEFAEVSNGEIHQNTANRVRNSFESTITLSCRAGYIRQGSSQVTCGADGQWQGQFSCKQSVCPEYPTVSSCIENAETAHNMYIMTCMAGDDVSVTEVGHGTTDCINGHWVSTELACYCDCHVDQNTPNLVIQNLNAKGFLPHSATLSWSCSSGTQKNISGPIKCIDGKMKTPSCSEAVTTKPSKPATDGTSATDKTGTTPVTTDSGGQTDDVNVRNSLIVSAVAVSLVIIYICITIFYPMYRTKKKSSAENMPLKVNPGENNEITAGKYDTEKHDAEKHELVNA